MPHPPRPTRFAATRRGALSLALIASPFLARADEPATQPTKGTRPLLQQLNAETQSLYHEVQAGVVRIQLPPPRWAGVPLAEQDNPVHKWGDALDPAVKQRLQQEQRDAAKGQYRKISAVVEKTAASKPATTQASAGPATRTTHGAWTITAANDDTLVLHPASADAGALRLDAGGSVARDGQIIAGGGRVAIDVTPASSFTPNNIGLVLDTQGHILVPICVEREAFDPNGVRCAVGPGQMATARFVGSDRQTNITLLKLDKPLGAPVKLTPGVPQEGTLTMFLAPNSGVGRLMIWTNELKDWGVVVAMEGGVYGFARHGQFLSAAACKPAIDQLLKVGTVKRPKLGLEVKWVQSDDPSRETDAALGTQPAVRVNDVAADSPAASAGLKTGDLILRVNDQPVGDPSSFAAALSDPAPKASVKFLRDGREQTLTLDLPQDR
jgi:hypothetical protein